MTNNNPLMILVSVVSTLVAGGGLYLQWIDHTKVEQDTAQVVTTNANATHEVQQIVDKQVIADKQVMVESAKHQEINNKTTDTQPELAAVSHKDDLPPLTLSIDSSKQPSLDNLELPPPTKDFEDFDKAGF
jgi:hypothetical protein